jgi:hypothetical protein
MDEERIGFFSQVSGSIRDIKAYRNFIKGTTGKAVLYLMLLSFIFGTMGLLRTMYDINTGVAQLMRYLEVEIPDFILQDGELEVDGPMPIILTESDDYIFIIDTSGHTEESELEHYYGGVLIGKHDVVIRDNYKTERYSFAMLQGMSLTKADMIRIIPFLRYINIFVLVLGLIFYFVGKLLGALGLSIAGLIITSRLRYKLPFGHLYRLSIYTLTLPIIIEAALRVLAISIPFFVIIYYAIALIYLYKAVDMLKETGEREEPVSNLY